MGVHLFSLEFLIPPIGDKMWCENCRVCDENQQNFEPEVLLSRIKLTAGSTSAFEINGSAYVTSISFHIYDSSIEIVSA